MVAHIDRPHFVITNGTWSTDRERTLAFMDFCMTYNCFIVVSGTPWHRRHQNREILDLWAGAYPENFRLKPKAENFHAMGRLEGKMKFSCTHKCATWDRALRIAVQPDGSIIFQNCDGVYPVVGNIDEPFAVIDARIQELRMRGFEAVCPHFAEQGDTAA